MTDELQEKIAVLCAGQVRFHVPMREITSMRVGGRADCLAFPPTREHLASLVVFLRGKGIPLFVGGNWTNVLIRDGGFRGVLISLQKLTALRRCSGAAGDEHWEAEAGVSLGSLVRLAKEEGFSGLEFCAGIPGSVGGAVKMNAGAWGKEMRDVLESVTIMSSDGVVNTVAAEKLAFRYRALNLAPGSIIVEAMFHVIPAPREQVAARVEEILAWRKVRHPLDYPSAGSIFKNPPGASAGRIIEELGLKGMRAGGAEIAERHANFIINRGQATTADVLKLIAQVQQVVKGKKGITLEPEVVIEGDDETPT